MTRILALCLASLVALATPAAQQSATYDIVIRNGRVLDGMGNPWIVADVAIKDGRFVKIGRVTGTGQRELDARGRYVSPGWIDMMDQSGAVLRTNGLADNKLRMGVTTAIGGEGGTPVGADRVAEYFAGLEKTGISINFGSYFNETQARNAVIGNTARAPTAEELLKMQAILETAMQGGAMGMTTALIYPPGTFASTDELAEMARVAAKYGGTYATHMRDEGKDLIAAITEAITIGERAGLPVEIFHLKAAWQPGWGTLMKQAGQTIDAARARGVDVAADMYVYMAGGTGLEATIPTWAQEGGRGALIKRLADPAIREQLKKEIVSGVAGWSNLVEAAGGWDRVVLANARNDENAKFNGKSLAAIAREWNKEPADAAFDLVSQGNGRVMAIYHMMTEPDVETALRFPWTSIGSDAGASATEGGQDPTGLTHPRAYGNFPRVIARYVRERGVLSLTEAVRKMTSWPATRMRLTGRGAIREGLWADVVVFDYDTIQDRATYDEPRLSPDGIDYVLVNGVLVIEKGQHTGAKPGQVLYGPGRVDPGTAPERTAAAAVSPQAAAAATSACVELGAPKPGVSYVHRYSDTSGSTEYSNQWEQFTATGSRLVTTKIRPATGVSTYVSRHRVEDDVFVLEATTASGTDGGGPFTNSMTFSPGAIGDPAFRACTGRTWTIAAVGVTHKSMQGAFSARTDPGTLTIVAIHEPVTVPAGTFDTVRYTKTMNSGRGQVRDEFWKSIEHGITVKRNSTQPGAVATEVLIAIR